MDPAVDFGRLYRDLGRAAHSARLAYGIGTGQERYVDKSLAAMAWLFPEGQGGGLIGK